MIGDMALDDRRHGARKEYRAFFSWGETPIPTSLF
jgi:hypothetical protein